MDSGSLKLFRHGRGGHPQTYRGLPHVRAHQQAKQVSAALLGSLLELELALGSGRLEQQASEHPRSHFAMAEPPCQGAAPAWHPLLAAPMRPSGPLLWLLGGTRLTLKAFQALATQSKLSSCGCQSSGVLGVRSRFPSPCVLHSMAGMKLA